MTTPDDGPVQLATTDDPFPGQRAWVMNAVMKDGKRRTVSYDLLGRERIRCAVFVMSALKALNPADVEDYSVWTVK